MIEIVKINKNYADVIVNDRRYRIDSENVEEQTKFMEKVVPQPKSVFSFLSGKTEPNSLSL